jgi:hypothetical protein
MFNVTLKDKHKYLKLHALHQQDGLPVLDLYDCKTQFYTLRKKKHKLPAHRDNVIREIFTSKKDGINGTFKK